VSRDIVVLGVSAGGLEAVCNILSALPEQIGFALIIVQHRSKDSTALCEVLQTCGGRPVREGMDKEEIEIGKVYLAPADYHLFVEGGHFELSVDAPQFYSRPSIDLTFESIADEYRSRAIGLVMTGANRDGARGLRRIVERGGYALIQDPASAEVPVMPLAAINEVPSAEVIPLEAIPARLCELAPVKAEGKVKR
jgi:two-component system, chemotaxis family, protein-glutamate methylesterase/glutaminase